MKRHQHKWKSVGYHNGGFGISTECPIYWCRYCGAINKTILGLNNITKPRKK